MNAWFYKDFAPPALQIWAAEPVTICDRMAARIKVAFCDLEQSQMATKIPLLTGRGRRQW
jgi:hypothetical protein